MSTRREVMLRVLGHDDNVGWQRSEEEPGNRTESRGVGAVA
jgi:hypothetical protein